MRSVMPLFQPLPAYSIRVRHKTLDLIGDLALLGTPIKGHVTAARAGHASNVEFVKKLKRVYAKELEELWNGDADE